MSTDGQILGAITGAVIGGVFGGPTGAFYGMQIGTAIGGYVDPPTIQGPKLGELALQTSKEGVPRPIVFGTARFAGNLIAVTKPVIRKVSSGGGGKGGGGGETKSEHVYRTYAVRICEGPISGLRRVWRDGTLIYSTAGPVDGYFKSSKGNNLQFSQKATIYLGDYDQSVDPVLQAAFGVDNATPYRGTAYMVVDDEDLTQRGGSVPSYTFEVERCEGTVVTSRPYAVEDITNLELAMSQVSAYLQEAGYSVPPEGSEFSINDFSVSLEQITYVTYSDGDPEGTDFSINDFSASVERIYYTTYSDGDPEGTDFSINDLSVSVERVYYITYSDGDPEGTDFSINDLSVSVEMQ